jgi:hypothetical protein
VFVLQPNGRGESKEVEITAETDGVEDGAVLVWLFRTPDDREHEYIIEDPAEFFADVDAARADYERLSR